MKSPEFAQAIALQAVAWIAQDGDMLRNFLAATGMGEADLRQRLEQPEFLAAVLDFVVMDDNWVLACARFAGIAPQELMEARQNLPGGDAPHWT